MADCSPFALPPLTEDAEQQTMCNQINMLSAGDDARSSSKPSLASRSSSGLSQAGAFMQKSLEAAAAAKLRQMRENKEKHRKKLRESLPPLDELKVKR